MNEWVSYTNGNYTVRLNTVNGTKIIQHLKDTNIHLSSLDREKLDSIIDMEEVERHISNNDIHVTEEEKTTWNSKID
jgi:sulfopyruvate decarboxylase TPP-binding subunit